MASSDATSKARLFQCLLFANFLQVGWSSLFLVTRHPYSSPTSHLPSQYLEAGAVPALLLQLSISFGMGSGQQGLLGGVVYLSLSLGSPFAGYLLRNFDHKRVISTAVFANMFFTFLWAMTPVGHTFSTHAFISLRFLMGLCQCILCVFLPLWTNENAPAKSCSKWMSYLQVQPGKVELTIQFLPSLRSLSI
jgi:MFS family permease